MINAEAHSLKGPSGLLTRRQLLLTGMVAAGTGLWSGQSTAELSARWVRRAEMPFPIQEIYPALITVDGVPLIVNAGGLALGVGDPVHADTVVYEPLTDVWSDGVSLPDGRHHLTLIWDGEALHALGGFKRRLLKAWEMRTEHWVTRDPRTEPWQEAKALPGPRGEAVCLYHEGAIHLMGGRVPKGDGNGDWSDHTDTGLHWVFDLAEGAWSERRPLPEARNSSTGAVLGGMLYVIGGRTVVHGTTPACHRYDPRADRWEEIAPLPPSRQLGAPAGQAGLAGAVSGGRLCVFGGEWFDGEGGGVYADAWAYDPEIDSWSALPTMTRPRHGLGAVAVGDDIYALGGAREPSGSGVSAAVDLLRFGDEF